MVREKLDHVYKFTTLDSGNHLVWHWQASTNGEWGVEIYAAQETYICVTCEKDRLVGCTTRIYY